ncbi:MAG: FHA domain-containing protein [Anaerolineales bacterium]
MAFSDDNWGSFRRSTWEPNNQHKDEEEDREPTEILNEQGATDEWEPPASPPGGYQPTLAWDGPPASPEDDPPPASLPGGYQPTLAWDGPPASPEDDPPSASLRGGYQPTLAWDGPPASPEDDPPPSVHNSWEDTSASSYDQAAHQAPTRASSGTARTDQDQDAQKPDEASALSQRKRYNTTLNWDVGQTPPPVPTARDQAWVPNQDEREDTGNMLPWRGNNIDAQRSAPAPPNADTGAHPMMWLIIRAPEDYRGTVLFVPPNGIIGRGRDAEVQWRDPRMSRQHAVILLNPNPEAPYEGQVYMIEPLSARNGLWINDQKIEAPTPVYENDVIIMGDTVFVVKILD